MAESVRLQRYLSAAGVAARRKAEDLISAGRVTVNGEIVTVLGTKIDPDHDAIEVDGEAVVALDKFYVLFNKPKGCITAVSDDRGRPTVMDYLPNVPVPVKPVGRLDFYSEGVLLLTNDGELAARLLAPASHVPKTYHVKVHGNLERNDIAALREGITLDDGTTTLPAEVEILPGESKYTWLGVTIHEGKHRQIHRMIEALGYQVDKLQRVAFANLTFHELRVGDARELTQQELNQLRDTVGLDHSSVARGRWRSKREETDIPRRARAKARAEAEAEAGEGGADLSDEGFAQGGSPELPAPIDHPTSARPSRPGFASEPPGRGAPRYSGGEGGGPARDARPRRGDDWGGPRGGERDGARGGEMPRDRRSGFEPRRAGERPEPGRGPRFARGERDAGERGGPSRRDSGPSWPRGGAAHSDRRGPARSGGMGRSGGPGRSGEGMGWSGGPGRSGEGMGRSGGPGRSGGGMGRSGGGARPGGAPRTGDRSPRRWGQDAPAGRGRGPGRAPASAEGNRRTPGGERGDETRKGFGPRVPRRGPRR